MIDIVRLGNMICFMYTGIMYAVNGWKTIYIMHKLERTRG